MQIASLTAIAAAIATMATAGPLAVTSSVLVERHVAAADGTTRIMLAHADHAAPGDRVVVAIDYRNTGRAPITGLVLANPVPRGLVYRGPASGNPAPEVSADGRNFAATLPAGGTPAEVTMVRWRLAGALAPGGGGRLAFVAMLK